MGYMRIDNLYKNQAVLSFKEVYALEKVHGTSAHIHYSNDVEVNQLKLLSFLVVQTTFSFVSCST